MCSYFGIGKQIAAVSLGGDIQYRLKLTGGIRQGILDALRKHGWSPRNADIRRYPTGDIDHREFIRAYVQIHSTLDFRKGRPRLRVYGNRFLIDGMNDIIPTVFYVARKTPQRITDKTYALYYQRRSEIAELLPGFNLNGGFL